MNTSDDFIAYERVLETHNPGDIAFLRSLLDASGIAYFIQGEHVSPFIAHGLPMRLLVKKDQAGEAREILKDIELSYITGGVRVCDDLNDDEESG
jgi:hypothetical protein